MSYLEGYTGGSTTLYDRRLAAREGESALLDAQIKRKIDQEKLLLKQGEAQREADAYAARKKEYADFTKQFAPQPTAGLTQADGAQAPSVPLQEVQAPGGPGAPAPGAAPAPPAPGAPAGAPAMVGGKGGVPKDVAPFISWLGANEGIRKAFSRAMLAEDGETQRKILGIYENSVGGPKDRRPADVHGYNQAVADGSWDPATQGGYMDYLLKIKNAGAMRVDLKGETAYVEGGSRSANARRDTYLKEGIDGAKNSRDYGRMYQTVLRTGATGAFAEIKLNLRKITSAIGIGEELAEAITGIEDGDVAGLELIRVQMMQRVFDFISETKGAISEREMAAFQSASPGLENTRRGNLLILEQAQLVAEGTIARSEYIRRHAPIKAGAQALEDAEAGWKAHLKLVGPAREELLQERIALIKATDDSEIGALMEHSQAKPMQQAFYERNGWLPKGMKVNPRWKVDFDG